MGPVKALSYLYQKNLNILELHRKADVIVPHHDAVQYCGRMKGGRNGPGGSDPGGHPKGG